MRSATDYFVVDELEQRLLFSADVGVLAPELPGTKIGALDLPQYQSPVLPVLQRESQDSAATHQENGPRHEVVFIDGAVDGAQDMADQLVARQDPSRILDVYVLDPSLDGVAQISAFLATQHDLDGIHIISHGSDGMLQLGSTQLDSSSLRNNALAISAWGTALSEQGDMLLYGCDVAQTGAGQQFVDSLARLTGADIAASNDLTGGSGQGGDWNLEYSHGQIETALAPDRAMQFSYSGVLAIITVTSNADSGAGTLREAITLANAGAGADTINFSIGSGLQTITLLTQLDMIVDEIHIDGSTQPGGSGNAPGIEVNGTGAPGTFRGFTISGSGASGSSIKGLALNNFTDAIFLTQTSNVIIQGNYIGTDASGTVAVGNTGAGIVVQWSQNNQIGGSSAAQRNVISGNSGHGIDIRDLMSTGNVITGNYIGVDASGLAGLSNGWSGVNLLNTSGNTVGGTSAGQRNVISANLQSGINLSGSSTNTIVGNYIGVDASGTTSLGNVHEGISLSGNSTLNTIGGTSAAARNIISGNERDGILLGSGADGNAIYGNYIGLNATGTGVLHNIGSGISLSSDDNEIGSVNNGAGNVIAGNGGFGIVFNGASGNLVKRNFIGVAADGLTALGNSLSGVRLTASSSNNSIGGFNQPEGNIIANNGGNGIDVLAGGGNTNDFTSNLIFNNAGLGIDLNNDGVTNNDNRDVDAGPNNLQNFPVISTVTALGSDTAISGTLNSTPNTRFRLEFYANSVRDGSNNGQGEIFIGTVDVTTNASGNASFNVTFTTGTAELWISALATSLDDFNTSEFAASINRPGSATTHAPVGAANTVVALEDTAYTFSAGEFGFSDPGDTPANAFVSVHITSIPASGTLRLGNTVLTAGAEVLRSAIDSGQLTYTGAANVHGAAVSGFTFQVRDGGATNNLDTTPRAMTIDIRSVNDAPVSVNTLLSIQEDQSHTFGIGNFPFADTNDSPANALAAVYIDTLPAQGTLMLNGAAYLAGTAVSAAALSAGQLVYIPLADSTATVNLTFRVQDNGGTANGGVDTSVSARTMTIQISPVNDAPVITTSNGTTAYAENGAAVAVDSQLALSDVDNSSLISAVVAFTNGSQRTDDILGFSNTGAAAMGNISASYDVQNGMLTLVSAGGTATLAQWQTALRAVTFSNSSQNPDTTLRSIAFTVNDGALSSVAAGKNLSVAATNNAPALSLSATVVDYHEGAAPVLVNDSVAVSDVDNTTLASATVSISNGLSGGDQLQLVVDAAAMGNITASYDATTGTLTLVSAGANATLAQWQTALAGITYSNSSQNPHAGARVISFSINDGTADSAVSTKLIRLTTQNDAPTLTSPIVVAVHDEGRTPLAVNPFLTVNDVDNGTLASARVAILAGLASDQDRLAFTNAGPAAMGNIAAVYDNASGVLTLTSAGATATLAQWQNALRSVTYANSSTAPSTADRTIGIVVSDGALDSTTVTSTLKVVAVASAPVGTPNTLTVQDNASLTFGAADFGFSDRADVSAHQAGNRFFSVLITSLPSSGTLSLNGVPVRAGATVLVSDIEAGRLVYTPAIAASAGVLTGFHFQVGDDGSTANGGSNLDATPRLLSLAIVHVTVALPPAIVAPAPVVADPVTAPAPVPVERPVAVVANPSLIVLDPSLTAPAVSMASAGRQNAVNDSTEESEGARAASSTRASAAASAAVAAAAADSARRIDIPLTAGVRHLAIEVDTSIIKANVARLFAERTDNANAPAPIALATRVSAAPESGTVFKVDMAVQAAERRFNLLLEQKASSSESGIGVAHAPGGSATEENGKEVSAMRATAHTLEAAFAVSALGTVWVVARKAALVASLMSTAPAWMRIDPLPILGGEEEGVEEEENAGPASEGDSVEHLFVTEAAPGGQAHGAAGAGHPS